MSLSHKTVKTVHPKYRALVVAVSESNFANVSGVLTEEGTLYSDAFWKTFFGKDYLKNFPNFRYIGQGEDTKDGGTLLFAPSLTDDERNTPFRTMRSFGNHRWPAILKKLAFFQDNSFPLSASIVKNGAVGTANAPRTYDRQVYIPEINEGTLFFEEEFYSDVPYQIPQYEVPTATAVSYDVPGGASGSFPECLHAKVVIPDLRSGTQIFVAGAQSDAGGRVPGQIFPATNMEGWETYTLSDKQKFEMGYYRYRVTVSPPEEPEVIVR